MLCNAPTLHRPCSAGESCFDQSCGQVWIWPLWSKASTKLVDMSMKKISWSSALEGFWLVLPLGKFLGIRR